MFTVRDFRQIGMEGLDEAQALEQIKMLRRGCSPMRLNRPCTVKDGIVLIPGGEEDELLRRHDRECRKGRMLKFVPASGAASRMFQEWFEYLDRGSFASGDKEEEFVRDLKHLAFFGDLRAVVQRQGGDLDRWIAERRFRSILECILTDQGLNYGSLPKALLKFHTYPGGSRAAIEEHLVEAALYARDGDGVCRVHFTLSGEHEEKVRSHLTAVRGSYERRWNVSLDIGVSVQSSSTNTIAADGENRPFRDDRGRLVFRPGGHGALLYNLDRLDGGDIVFIKNIDNIVPDRLKEATVRYKKMLSGYLIGLQEKIFHHLTRMADGPIEESALDDAASFCREELWIDFPPGFGGWSGGERQRLVFSKLNRPVRVCGMVRNEGEAGGGPFWVDEADGTQSIQIVEASQVDSASEIQRGIWRRATHFNPVDLVCGLRNFSGAKFDLTSFVNRNAFSITQKSEKGRALRALERPGLWNGSMHDWTTVFVEVPIETFNPVKTVRDLLRPQHQPEG